MWFQIFPVDVVPNVIVSGIIAICCTPVQNYKTCAYIKIRVLLFYEFIPYNF